MDEDSKENDALNRTYAEHLNAAVARERSKCPSFPDVWFGYAAELECDVDLHTSRPMKDLRRRFKHEAVGIESHVSRANTTTEANLVEQILTNPDYSGFVAFEGGEESVVDAASLQLGFCMQRYRPQEGSFLADLGPGALEAAQDDRAESLSKEDAEAILKRAFGKASVTTSRLSFPKKKVSVVSVGLFRWLVKERGLRNFVLRHYCHYSYRSFLRSFVVRLLTKRQAVKRAGGSPLEDALIKVILNALYGFLYIEQPRFSRSSVGLSRNMRHRLRDKNLIKALPLAVLTPRKKKAPDILLCCVHHKPDAIITNACQVATQILSCSKLVFFSQLCFILRTLDPKKGELCYLVSWWGGEEVVEKNELRTYGTLASLLQDTDSAVFWCAEEKFADNTLPELRSLFETSRVFVDEKSSLPQGGKFKVEGVYKRGFFRALKVLSPTHTHTHTHTRERERERERDETVMCELMLFVKVSSIVKLDEQ